MTTWPEQDRVVAEERTILIVGESGFICCQGLEAVVILAAPLASMVGTRRVYRQPVAWGGSRRFLASALTWWLMQPLLSAFAGYGERLEAAV